MKKNNVYMILTNGFDPDVRVYKEAKYLVQRGYNVTILCWDRKCIYQDKPEENIEGIEIRRFFIPSIPGSGLKQMKSYLKFKKEVLKFLNKQEYQYLHCHDLDGAIIGILAKKRAGSKVIFDMHEYYGTGNMKKFAILIKKIVKYIQNKSDNIIYVNEKQIEDISLKNQKKLIYLPNYPESANFENVKHIESNKLRITYAGYVRHVTPITNLIKAIEPIDDIEVHIHGTGEHYKEIKELEGESKNIMVTGAYKHQEIAQFYSNTDLMYIVYNKGNKNDENALPTKFFEAIICEIPVIVSRNSVLEKMVQKYDIGFSADGTDFEDIRKIILQIKDNKSILQQKRDNIKKIKTNFIWEDISKNLNTIYIGLY